MVYTAIMGRRNNSLGTVVVHFCVKRDIKFHYDRCEQTRMRTNADR